MFLASGGDAVFFWYRSQLNLEELARSKASTIDVEQASGVLRCYHQVRSPAVGPIVWTRNYVVYVRQSTM